MKLALAADIILEGLGDCLEWAGPSREEDLCRALFWGISVSI